MFSLTAHCRRAVHAACAWTLAAGAIALISCSNGGGSSHAGNTGQDLADPVIPLVGPTGRYSMTPDEANQARGTRPPPLMPPAAAQGINQFVRFEVPFTVLADSFLSDDPLLAPFSYLNGNILITDEAGNHLRSIVLVDGRDAFGNNRTDDEGFPHDYNAAGDDQNTGKGVILFVADDGDNDLSTICAFGGQPDDSDQRCDTTEIKQIRLTLDELNGRSINGFYTVTVDDGTSGDAVAPEILWLLPEDRDPTDPTNSRGASSRTRFIVRFSEPMVPTEVGKSSILDTLPFLGNMPLLPVPPQLPSPPLPHTFISAQLNATSAPLYIPTDVNPLNSNNLATYIVTPLINLPPNQEIEVVVVDAGTNKDPATQVESGPLDLAGNAFKPGGNYTRRFDIGPGRAPVNSPVSPEVVYWLPGQGRGMGAIDLNGFGFTTNAPGANANDWRKAALITKTGNPNAARSGGWDQTGTAIAIKAHPGNLAHNDYRWVLGTGSYTYGPNDPKWDADFWEDPSDPGNQGTPVPGINEMSSGYETLVRNAEGEVFLTGTGEFAEVGVINDCVVGEFLDKAIYDTQSFFNQTTNHISMFWGAAIANNSIGEPPSPNPPPSRYWVGLQPIDILIDQSDPGGQARMIEGEEVWAGNKMALTGYFNTHLSYQFVLPSQNSPLEPDRDPPPMFFQMDIGPSPQSGTSIYPFSSRQQVGNFLYVTDVTNRRLHALNSNTFQVIQSFEVPDPTGVGIAPDSRFLFVSSRSDNVVTVIGADPLLPDFHTEVARIPVGNGPTTVSVQPDGEDVLVVNSQDDSISIIDLGSLTVRETITALISGPKDITLSPRQGAFGWGAGVYFGYIANFFGNSLLVYESGPAGPRGIGCDNILGSIPNEGDNTDILAPRGLTYSPYPNDSGLLAGGCFVAHRDGDGTGVVSHVQFTHQAIFGTMPCTPPPGLFFLPPGFIFREFEVVGTWGGREGSRLVGEEPNSVILPDMRRDLYMLNPPQAPNNSDRGVAVGGLNSRYQVRFPPPTDPRAPIVPAYEPERMYVSFNDQAEIQILDPVRIGISLGFVESPPRPVKKLITYWQQ